MPELTVRTQRVMYYLLGGILRGALVLGIFAAIMRSPSLWPPTFVMAVLLFLAMAILKSTKLVLTAEAIHFRSLFSVKHVLLKDVVKAQFLIGFKGQQPYQRIVVTVRHPKGERAVVINAGLLDRVELRRWMKELNSRLS